MNRVKSDFRFWVLSFVNKKDLFLVMSEAIFQLKGGIFKWRQEKDLYCELFEEVENTSLVINSLFTNS